MATKKRSAKKAVPKPKALSPEEQVRAIARTCRGPLSDSARVHITALLAKGKLEEARRADAEGHQACGYDVNELILKHPFDGKDHTERCPRCKTEISFRSPVFD
jgi:hypothetical protein